MARLRTLRAEHDHLSYKVYPQHVCVERRDRFLYELLASDGTRSLFGDLILLTFAYHVRDRRLQYRTAEVGTQG